MYKTEKSKRMKEITDGSNIEGRNREKVVSRRIAKVFRSLWTGEHGVYDEPVDKVASDKFNMVLKALKDREKTYLEEIRADGRLEEIAIEGRDSRAVKHNDRSQMENDRSDN